MTPNDFPIALHSGTVAAFGAYLLGVASPGPSNMAIMAMAMSRGRAQALALSAGVVTGSLTWGFAAAFGLSALMQAYSWSLLVLKWLGGGYLLWLSWKAARQACAPAPDAAGAGNPLRAPVGAEPARWRSAYAKGLAMHLTNPKAIFVWLSIVSLALPPDHPRGEAFWVVAACGLIGAAVFFGYALAFSTEWTRRAYRKTERVFNAALSAMFAYAGLRLWLSRSGAA